MKTACVVRFGGFGDLLQSSGILPELKRQGYHVTMMTTPSGQKILAADPNVDGWIIETSTDGRELSHLWSRLAPKFDKFINLTESVEGTLLAVPGRMNYTWPHAVRHMTLNRNYLEWTAQLAELPYRSEARFYPTKTEKISAINYLQFACKQRAQQKQFAILWALAGTSIHKFYPWQDHVIGTVLKTMPEAIVIFTGDRDCKTLEAGWENEPRVLCESGEMGIRDTLALAQAVNCVVGPETGVLNAVSFESVPKVILLSHSSVENLTKHWTETASIEPIAPCHPCHQIHYSSATCPTEPDSGAAICQSSIDPARVVDAIRAAYLKWQATFTSSGE